MPQNVLKSSSLNIFPPTEAITLFGEAQTSTQ